MVGSPPRLNRSPASVAEQPPPGSPTQLNRRSASVADGLRTSPHSAPWMSAHSRGSARSASVADGLRTSPQSAPWMSAQSRGSAQQLRWPSAGDTVMLRRAFLARPVHGPAPTRPTSRLAPRTLAVDRTRWMMPGSSIFAQTGTSDGMLRAQSAVGLCAEIEAAHNTVADPPPRPLNLANRLHWRQPGPTDSYFRPRRVQSHAHSELDASRSTLLLNRMVAIELKRDMLSQACSRLYPPSASHLNPPCASPLHPSEPASRVPQFRAPEFTDNPLVDDETKPDADAERHPGGP
ncbi:hypothetical protein T492DRAFT_837097 [Pavlovales sp. CCMP2436]|nr:hypothetical protein T492DRAFT_837097 [Pavlovales sp. CCMP2436]